jgi:hypothetical protein
MTANGADLLVDVKAVLNNSSVSRTAHRRSVDIRLKIFSAPQNPLKVLRGLDGVQPAPARRFRGSFAPEPGENSSLDAPSTS